MNELGSTGRQSTGSARGTWPAADAAAARPGSPYPAPRMAPDGRPGPVYAGPRGPVEQYGRPYAPPNAGAPYGGPHRRPYAPHPGRAPEPGSPHAGWPHAGTPHMGPQGPGSPYAGPPYAGSPHAGTPHAGPHGRMPHAGAPGAGARQPGPQHPVPPGGADPGSGSALPTGDRRPGASGASARPRRGRVGRWIGMAVVVAALGGVGWYVTFGAPSPVTAAVGDCVAQTGENDVAVVGCGEPSARFRVAGRVENKTMIEASLFACSDFPDAGSSFWQGVQDKPGTVLCLAPLHP